MGSSASCDRCLHWVHRQKIAAPVRRRNIRECGVWGGKVSKGDRKPIHRAFSKGHSLGGVGLAHSKSL